MTSPYSLNGRMNPYMRHCNIYFKDLLRKYPDLDLAFWLQIQRFYNGLGATTHSMIDTIVGGALMNKTSKAAAYGLLEQLVSNNDQWSFERARPKPIARVMELDQINNLATQMANLSKQIGKLGVNFFQSNNFCEICACNHTMAKCHQGNSIGHSNLEHAAYVGNPNRYNNPYYNTYNPSWRNHSKFS